MKLWAISDLHLDIEQNRAGLLALGTYPEDWLIVAGDLSESVDLFAEALVWLSQRFARLFWAPGNHDLWLNDSADGPRSSMTKYASLVEITRRRGVVTPEDPYVVWPPTGYVIVPLCTLYDYSFRPADVERADVVAWAAEKRSVGADEKMINLAPLSGMDEGCALRCERTEAPLARELPADARTVLVGHYPLREDLVWIPRIPRFAPWSGGGRGKRTSACASDRLARRYALRGGLIGIPKAVEPYERSRRVSAGDIAGPVPNSTMAIRLAQLVRVRNADGLQFFGSSIDARSSG